jgi:hypothetical protein
VRPLAVYIMDHEQPKSKERAAGRENKSVSFGSSGKNHAVRVGMATELSVSALIFLTGKNLWCIMGGFNFGSRRAE